MIETHTRILGIAPYDGMRTAMEQAAQAYPNVEMDIYTGDLEDGQAIVQQMPPNSYDCIISRGGTAALIRQVTDLPVVDIHISVYDVLRTMKLAENYSSLYAIVGFPSITEPAHTLCSLLDFNLDILTVNNAAEVRHTLERLQQGGYRMVVCDMVTHTIAREMGFDAFLITSGVESLHAAIDQAVNISSWFGHLRQENLFLRSITQGQNGRVIVMESNGDLFYSSISEVPAELSSVLQSHIREIPASGNLRFYYTERDQLYSITAQQLLMNNVQRYLFYCVPARIPLHSSRPGLRTLNKGECEYLFANSFYSLSGAMGTQAAEIRSLALLRQPVFIYGEPGTGKEQIARYLYLHSSLANHPFIVVNCALLNEKTWDFLLNHYNSPLSATGNTIYFQNFESIPPQWSSELLAAIEETGLARRVRLIFSCSIVEGAPVPEVLRHFSERLGSLALPLPSLRSRSDEIPSLSSLYLNSLNLELGKQLSGFEPRAIEMLRQYPWPNNYTQFKNVLRALAALSDNVAGLKALVKQAWACGHRRIAFIHGEKTSVTENRIAGFYQACEELGLEIPEEYVRDGVYHDVERCAEETRALLALPQRPTCIIFPDDFSALGGYNALAEAGLSIPDDISVMGYDGIYLSRVVNPSLVTYQQNTAALGQTAADKLIELIEHPRVTLPEQIRVSGRLLSGGSVRSL